MFLSFHWNKQQMLEKKNIEIPVNTHTPMMRMAKFVAFQFHNNIPYIQKVKYINGDIYLEHNNYPQTEKRSYNIMETTK